MPITITFQTVAEDKPTHNQEIVYLKPSTSFGFEGFSPRDCTAEYVWVEIDENGDDTGSQTIYNGEDTLEGHRLQLMFDCWFPGDSWLWCDAEAFSMLFELEGGERMR